LAVDIKFDSGGARPQSCNQIYSGLQMIERLLTDRHVQPAPGTRYLDHPPSSCYLTVRQAVTVVGEHGLNRSVMFVTRSVTEWEQTP